MMSLFVSPVSQWELGSNTSLWLWGLFAPTVESRSGGCQCALWPGLGERLGDFCLAVMSILSRQGRVEASGLHMVTCSTASR
jgi:hypothetical protein